MSTLDRAPAPRSRMPGKRARCATSWALLILVGLPTASRGLDLARYLPPPDASYTAEEVRVRGLGRYSLAGTLTLPTRGVLRNGHVLRYPAVLLVSGAGRQDRDGVAAGDTARGALAYRPLYDLADTLTRRGIAVLRLDDRGVGASTGSLDSATTPDRAEDARAAVDYLRRRSEIDPRRIAVLGMSEGASIAALVASTDAGIRGIVLMAGPAGTATQVSAPALVLQGDADDTVPPAGADELGAALRTLSRDVTVRHFPGLGHAFVLPEDLADGGLAVPAALKISRPVRGAIADWMTTRLGGPVEGPAPQASRRRHRHHR